ncbi:MAG: transposase [Saprospiraceae bacterium]|nr:transposase [Saprospiraceae bacterium]
MASVQLQYVCFEYRDGRGREGPMYSYETYKGDLQTDAYEVYSIINKAYGHINHFFIAGRMVAGSFTKPGQ